MLFTEPTFLFVFLPVLLGLYALPRRFSRNALLLVAGLAPLTEPAIALPVAMVG